MKNKANQIALHIVCSLAFLLFPILASPDFPNVNLTLSNPYGVTEVITHFLLLVFFYLCYFWLIPKFYFKQKYWLFVALIIVYAALMMASLRFSFSQFPNHKHHFNFPGRFGPQGPFPGKSFDGRHHNPPRLLILRDLFFDYNMYLLLIVLFIAMLLKTSQRWRQLQNEKLETELSYLKSQINPHFLFNTLNSIYSLAIEKSDYTATAVVKLSGMMRYIISESNKHFVLLQKELSYIQDYIELQKFRLGNTAMISYVTEGPADGLEIAPLLLITFVENAFKYGVNPEEYSDIFINIKIADGSLSLKVSNNKVTHSVHNKESSGLGITNTKHRLEMLYPGRYSLDIRDGHKMFIVELQITLK